MPPRAWEVLTPVVLCGGQSRRFGSNKLLAVLPGSDQLMIDRPVAALRALFGSRVHLCGQCAPEVLTHGDGHIDDPYAGIGPAGGVLASLEARPGGVFVLSGDLPWIDSGTIRVICEAYASAAAEIGAGELVAVLARSEVVEPCIGIYTSAAAEFLRAGANAERPPPLHALIPTQRRLLVDVVPERVRNVNRPEELGEGPQAGASKSQ